MRFTPLKSRTELQASRRQEGPLWPLDRGVQAGFGPCLASAQSMWDRRGVRKLLALPSVRVFGSLLARTLSPPSSHLANAQDGVGPKHSNTEELMTSSHECYLLAFLYMKCSKRSDYNTTSLWLFDARKPWCSHSAMQLLHAYEPELLCYMVYGIHCSRGQGQEGQAKAEVKEERI